MEKLNKTGCTRLEAAKLMDEFKVSEESLRTFAKNSGVPRTTLQHWNNRISNIDLPESTVDFFESAEGQKFLHILYVAMLMVLHECGNASLRCISMFLQKSQLNHFLPASKTNLQKNAAELENVIIAFSEQEQKRMAASMPSKRITVAQDETFPKGVCLVAVEPVSNFIILEQMVSDRKTETWDMHMNQALSGLPVEVIQGVGDEARSLVKHVTEGLGAHHSPDLFHIQQELTKAAAAQLKLNIKRNTEELEKKKKKVTTEKQKQEKYEKLDIKPKGRPPIFSSRIEKAQADELEQVEKLILANNANDAFIYARHNISSAYHPYSLQSGLPQSPETVEHLLNSAFDKIETVIEPLADTFKKKAAKARKQINNMRGTIVFYFTTIAGFLNNKNYNDITRMLIEDFLIPACYLKKVAGKTKDKTKKYEIELLADDLMVDYDRRLGLFAMYSEEELDDMLKTAEECADVFQRSSSPVEGRNGQLSLKYHNLHRLSDRKLKCLTAIHNFEIRRDDGTTAAERFFESKHQDMFEFLIKKFKLPGRPRMARSDLMVA